MVEAGASRFRANQTSFAVSAAIAFYLRRIQMRNPAPAEFKHRFSRTVDEGDHRVTFTHYAKCTPEFCAYV
ncbi:hypothetical protein KCP69_23760 [Salmonella enterica subsp. enterica]|nr:hypothetical protein KCP69_23760 [Salmonella enterica subsp. enterica]